MRREQTLAVRRVPTSAGLRSRERGIARAGPVRAEDRESLVVAGPQLGGVRGVGRRDRVAGGGGREPVQPDPHQDRGAGAARADGHARASSAAVSASAPLTPPAPPAAALSIKYSTNMKSSPFFHPFFRVNVTFIDWPAISRRMQWCGREGGGACDRLRSCKATLKINSLAARRDASGGRARSADCGPEQAGVRLAPGEVRQGRYLVCRRVGRLDGQPQPPRTRFQLAAVLANNPGGNPPSA